MKIFDYQVDAKYLFSKAENELTKGVFLSLRLGDVFNFLIIDRTVSIRNTFRGILMWLKNNKKKIGGNVSSNSIFNYREIFADG